MADQEKKALEIESLEVTELEDGDLEDVAGGNFSVDNPINDGCPVSNGNCPC